MPVDDRHEMASSAVALTQWVRYEMRGHLVRKVIEIDGSRSSAKPRLSLLLAC